MFKYEELTSEIIEKFELTWLVPRLDSYKGFAKIDYERRLIYIPEKEHHASYPEFGFVFIAKGSCYFGVGCIIPNEQRIEIELTSCEENHPWNAEQLEQFINEIFPNTMIEFSFFERRPSIDGKMLQRKFSFVENTVIPIILSILFISIYLVGW